MKALIASVLFSLILSACAIAGLTEEHVYLPDAPERLILKVNIQDVQRTGYAPSNDCLPEQFCMYHPHFWFKYKASISEVVLGSWKGKSISFVHLLHIAPGSPLGADGFYVVLNRVGPEFEEKMGVQYEAERILFACGPDDQEEINKILEKAGSKSSVKGCL